MTFNTAVSSVGAISGGAGLLAALAIPDTEAGQFVERTAIGIVAIALLIVIPRMWNSCNKIIRETSDAATLAIKAASDAATAERAAIIQANHIAQEKLTKEYREDVRESRTHYEKVLSSVLSESKAQHAATIAELKDQTKALNGLRGIGS